ncbi:MAG: helix-turn-helix domain-containing protein [Nitrososphaerales archaeon]|jgi:DNA-binding transcriptional ArsR family regulator
MRSLSHPERRAISLTGVLYALSDPARLEVVKALADGRERPCGEFGMLTKSTLSHHFKVLREAGVIRTKADGRRRLISLRREDLDARFPGLIAAVLDADAPI